MNTKGFLLLEVIITIVILTTGLISVSVSLSGSKRLIQKSRELFAAELVLREAMFPIEQQGSAEAISSEGSFQTHPGYQWRIASSEISESQLLHLTVDIFPASASQNSFSLETNVLKKVSR